ncbi:MAG TPA: c-type cytochrome [Bacteroidia bacterium]|nr:c-type cytochrome [Bacteroidia bacterium]
MVKSNFLKPLIIPAFVGLLSFSSVCAQDTGAGEKLFTENCASCHVIEGTKSIGPNLRGVTKKHKEEWLLKWIKNSQALISSGDATAVKLYEDNNKTVMSNFESLSDGEIKSILTYVETAQVSTVKVNPENPEIVNTNELTTAAGNSGFYSNTTLLVLLALVVVLILIGILLGRVKGMMRQMLAARFPDNIELNKPSWYEGKFLPWFKNLNPTIATLVAVLLVAVVAGGAYFKYANTEIGVQQGYAPTQPIAFDHKLHAGDYKIDCQYCHSTASFSKQASVPAVNTCMNCHKHIDAKDKYNGEVSPEIQKIRTAYEKNVPIKWIRIHNLPDLAYFNHAQHVTVGKVECQACHGPVETMHKVEQFASLQMGWCVNCHRQSDVDVANNGYYEELHKKLQGMGRKAISVEKNGGLECGKCHY